MRVEYEAQAVRLEDTVISTREELASAQEVTNMTVL
jgi:hypothetical protein